MKSTTKKLLSLLIAGAGMAGALAQASDIITFDAPDLTGVAVRPTIFVTEGFVFTSSDFMYVGGGGAGPDGFDNGSKTLSFAAYDLAAQSNTNAVTFRRQDAAAFDLTSLQFAPGYYSHGAGETLGVTVNLAGGGHFSENVATSTTGFSTLNLGLKNVTSVVLTGDTNGGAYLQIDNINMSPVPEPEAYGMLLGGIALLGLVARRKKAV